MMPLTKKNTKSKPTKKKLQPKRFVSDTGVYLQEDSMGELHKKMHEMLKQTIFLSDTPTPPSTPE